ncbi:MAG TPA: hypothetical protein VEU47_19125 [Candidatus Cybelea sp.]|nr:hypothetical protein [Candidatus Cybelea sp.]
MTTNSDLAALALAQAKALNETLAKLNHPIRIDALLDKPVRDPLLIRLIIGVRASGEFEE